jgi:Tol biopolymer transport system component
MDRTRKNFCLRPSLVNPKGFGFLDLLVGVILSAVLGCGSKPTNSQAPAPMPLKLPGQLSIEGENCCAALVPQSTQIVFLSRGRKLHSQSQVYIYDLALQQERRLTYHDGNDQGVTVHPVTKDMLYASTTDFLKEHPALLTKALGNFEALNKFINSRPLWTLDHYDLYRSRLDGGGIKRLTNELGFDGEAQFDPKGKEILFVKQSGTQTVLARMDENGSGLKRIFQNSENDGEPRYSQDGKQMTWVRRSEDQKTSQIWIAKRDGKNAQSLTVGPGLKVTPTWNPDGQSIIFSSDQGLLNGNFNLFSIQVDGTCLRRLTSTKGRDLTPIFAPEGRQLIVSSNRTGTWQLHLVDFSPPPCPGPGSDLHL